MMLEGKKILVTGASSGVGKQVAIDCSQQGAQLIITGRNPERLQETFSCLAGQGHVQYAADLTVEEKVKELVGKLSRINGLVHCAGVLDPIPIKFLNQQKIRETLTANFDMPVMLMAALGAQKKIEKGASLVFMSSISGRHPHRGNSLYCASKAAIESFSKAIALEFSHMGVRSNCICPAMIHTPMYERAEEGMSKETMAEHISGYPLGIGYPKDISEMAMFLLSEKSRWITGTNIDMDGGFILVK